MSTLPSLVDVLEKHIVWMQAWSPTSCTPTLGGHCCETFVRCASLWTRPESVIFKVRVPSVHLVHVTSNTPAERLDLECTLSLRTILCVLLNRSRTLSIGYNYDQVPSPNLRSVCERDFLLHRRARGAVFVFACL